MKSAFYILGIWAVMLGLMTLARYILEKLAIDEPERKQGYRE